LYYFEKLLSQEKIKGWWWSIREHYVLMIWLTMW